VEIIQTKERLAVVAEERSPPPSLPPPHTHISPGHNPECLHRPTIISSRPLRVVFL